VESADPVVGQAAPIASEMELRKTEFRWRAASALRPVADVFNGQEDDICWREALGFVSRAHILMHIAIEARP